MFDAGPSCATQVVPEATRTRLALCGPQGAVICETAEAAYDYTTLADDPATRQKTLISGFIAACMKAPPGECYEMIPDRRAQPGGVIHVRKVGTFDQVLAIIAEWQGYPGAQNAKTNGSAAPR
jgi:hypothetical protein